MNMCFIVCPKWSRKRYRGPQTYGFRWFWTGFLVYQSTNSLTLQFKIVYNLCQIKRYLLFSKYSKSWVSHHNMTFWNLSQQTLLTHHFLSSRVALIPHICHILSCGEIFIECKNRVLFVDKFDIWRGKFCICICVEKIEPAYLYVEKKWLISCMELARCCNF